MTRRSTVWTALWLSFALACAEPAEPTQVIVLVDADATLRPSVKRLGVRLEAFTGSSTTRISTPDSVAVASWPVKFVLTPRAGDARRTYRLDFNALDNGGGGLAKLAFEGGYVPHESRYVRVMLSENCPETESVMKPDVWRFGRTRDSALVLGCGSADGGDAGDTGAETDATVTDAGEPPERDSAAQPETDAAPMDAVGCVPADCGENRTCVRRGDTPPQCECVRGYRERDGRCEAESPCAQHWCEQECVVAGGAATCRCATGFRLNADGKTCYRPKWLPLETVAPALPGKLDEPGFGAVKVELEPPGSAMVAWYRLEGTNYVTYASRLQRGVGWSEPTVSEPIDSTRNYAPRFALNDQGDALAVWTRVEPEPRRTVVASCERGWRWEPEEVSSGASAANAPLVATSDNGAALAVWSESYQGMPALWSSSSATRQAGWSAPAVAMPSVMNSSYPLLLEMNETGRAFVVWDSPPSGTFTPVVASFRDENGSWLAAEPFEQFYFEIQIEGWAADFRGDVAAVVAEMPLSMIDWELRASVHRRGQGWIQPHSLATVNSRAYHADLAVSQTGSVFVVWNEGTAGVQRIVAARYDPVAGWSEAKAIGEGRLPHVAAFADGSALAVWDVPARKQLWFSRYVASTGEWLSAELIHTGVEVRSELDLAAEGERAIAAFIGTDGASESLWIAQFE